MPLTCTVARAGSVVLTVGFAANLSAQVVHGRVTSAETALPLSNAFVEAIDSSGAQRDAWVTDAAGLFQLSVGGPGSLTLRASVIGYSGAARTLSVAPTDTLLVNFQLSPAPIELEAMDVTAEEVCSGEWNSIALAHRIWANAREALELTRWTTERGLYRYDVELFTRRVDPRTGRVISDSRRRAAAWGDHPFRTPPGVDLVQNGYVQRTGGSGFQYYAPDVDVLLSDDFVDTHCFEGIVGEGAHAGEFGLAFRPVPGRDVPDIRGVFWLEGETSQLTQLEFRYDRLDRDFDVGRLGGEIDFALPQDGGWMVQRWLIRMPVVGIRPGARAGGPWRRELAAFEEVGGEVVRIRAAEWTAERSVPRGELLGTVVDSHSRQPVRDASVRLAGTGYRSRTDERGGFSMRGIVPGTYELQVYHPVLDSLDVDTLRVPVAARAGDSARVAVELPSRAALLARRCAEAGMPSGRDEVTVHGVVLDSLAGVPIPDAVVRVAWEEIDRVTTAGFDGTRRWTEVRADSRGRYLACGLPADTRLTATALSLGQISKEVRFRGAEGSAVEQDIRIPLSAAADVQGIVRTRDRTPPSGPVRVRLGEREAITDDSGRFQFAGLPAGRHALLVESLGYEAVDDAVTIDGRGPTFIEIVVDPAAIEVEGLEVSVSSGRVAEELARGTRVDRLTRADIEKASLGARDIAEVLRSAQLPFLSVRRSQFREGNGMFSREGLCLSVGRERNDDCRQPLVLLNDVQLSRPEFMLLSIDPSSIQSIEVIGAHDGQTRFGPDARFGVVLIYTR